jgi:hypothetical protein
MLAAAYAAVPGPKADVVRDRLDLAKRGEGPDDCMQQQGWVLTALQNPFRHLANGMPIEEALVQTVGEAGRHRHQRRHLRCIAGRCPGKHSDSGVLATGAVGATPLTDHEVARIFKRLAGPMADLDAADIAGHSTRIGAAHDLVEAGFDVAAIANAGGWKSLMMPNYYTRELRAKQSAMAQWIGRRKKETS